VGLIERSFGACPCTSFHQALPGLANIEGPFGAKTSQVLAMTSVISFWLVVIGFVYPLILLACPVLLSSPPWWFAEYAIFTGIVLPLFMGVALLIAKLNGAKMGWVTVAAFPLWIGVVNWMYIWFLIDVAVTA